MTKQPVFLTHLILICLILGLSSIARPDPVTITRGFHRDGQTFITFQEQPGVDAYHLYRSKDPIGLENIQTMEPVALNGETFEIRDGSSQRNACRVPFNTEPFPEEIVPDSVYSFHEVTGYAIDPINPETDFNTFADFVSDDEGLVVWTPAAGEGWEGSGDYFYAITAKGSKDISASSILFVQETDDRPTPQLIWQSPTGKTRVYQQFMALQRKDGIDWNPYFMGYAFIYSVEVPADYDYTTPEKLPVFIALHGGSSVFTPAGLQADSNLIRIQPNDRLLTWWFGWSSSYDYTGFRTNENQDPGFCVLPAGVPEPTTGPIVNYTEMQMLRAFFDIADHPDYNFDEERVFTEGPSMGATGALHLGIRYPNIFSAILSDKPLINFRTAGEPGTVCNVEGDPDQPLDACHKPAEILEAQVELLFGFESSAIPVFNQGPWMGGSAREREFDHLAELNGLPIFDYMDFIGMVTGNRIDKDGNVIGTITPNLVEHDYAYLMLTMGMRDCASSWDTQGRHLPRFLNDAAVGYSMTIEDTEHSYETSEFSFEDRPENMQVIPRYSSPSFSFDQRNDNRFNTLDYPRNLSFPAFVYTGRDEPNMPAGRPIPSEVDFCPDYDPDPSIQPLEPFEFGVTTLWRGDGLAPIVDEEGKWSAEIQLIDRTLARGDTDDDGSVEPPYLFDVTSKRVHVSPQRRQSFHPEGNDLVKFTATRNNTIVAEGTASRMNGKLVTDALVLTQEPTLVEFTIENTPEWFLIK